MLRKAVNQAPSTHLTLNCKAAKTKSSHQNTSREVLIRSHRLASARTTRRVRIPRMEELSQIVAPEEHVGIRPKREVAQPLPEELGVVRPDRIVRDEVVDDGCATKENADRDDEVHEGGVETAAVHPADDGNCGQDCRRGDLGLVGEPEAHAGQDPQAALPRINFLLKRSQEKKN